MFHINQSHMDVRMDGSRLDERLLSVCSLSKHQVFGGGIFGNIQMTPWIFLLFTLMFFPLSNYSCQFFFSLWWYNYIPIYSQPKLQFIIDWFFPILILPTIPSTQFWILISSVSIVIPITVISTWNFLFIYCLLPVCLSTMAL